MFLSSFYNPKQKKTKNISDFFDDTQLKDEQLLEVADIAINERNNDLNNVNKIVDDNIYDDLEVFSNESVFSVIDRTSTSIGRICLKNIIKNPSYNINELNKHQSILKVFINNIQLYEEIVNYFTELNKLERSVLWLYKEKTKEEMQIINKVYFINRFVKRFNHDENVLLIYNYFKIIFSPLYGILTPVLFFIGPYLYLRFFSNIRFDLNTYYRMLKNSFFGMSGGNDMMGNAAPAWSRYTSLLMTLFMYFHNIYNSVEVSVNTNNIINEFHKKLNSMSRFLEVFDELYFKTEKILNLPTKVVRCFKRLKDKLFQQEPFIFSNKGTILVCFKDILDNKKELLDVFEYIGRLDSIISIVKLYKEFNESRCTYCLPKFIDNKTPVFKAENLWHSYLNPKSVVGNTIQMGGDNQNNIVITGPNAGGKSTFIKSLTLSILLAQTIGIVPSHEYEITPFYILNTYLNIPDCKGKESLFEAEMHRARDHINKLKKIDDNQFSFVVMDEIFSSTNPEEGIAGGYSIGEALGKYKNSISCITTHFSYITNLENTSDYINYKIPITRDEDNNIIYPYKLQKGVSEQYIALELLKQKGFDQNIVERAIEVCKNLDLKQNYKSSAITPEVVSEVATEVVSEAIKEVIPEINKESIKEVIPQIQEEAINEVIPQAEKEVKQSNLNAKKNKRKTKKEAKVETKETNCKKESVQLSK